MTTKNKARQPLANVHPTSIGGLLDGLELFNMDSIDETSTLLSKMEALTEVLQGCTFEDGNHVCVPGDQVFWVALTLGDMAREVQEHVSAIHEQARNTWLMLKQRVAELDATQEVPHV